MKLINESIDIVPYEDEPQVSYNSTPDKVVWCVDTSDVIADEIRTLPSFADEIKEILEVEDYDEYEVFYDDILSAVKDWDDYCPIYSVKRSGLNFTDSFIHVDTKEIFDWKTIPLDAEVGIPVTFYAGDDSTEKIIYVDLGEIDWSQIATNDYGRHSEQFIPLEEFIHS